MGIGYVECHPSYPKKMESMTTISDRMRNYGASRRHVLNEQCTRAIARKCISPGDVVIDFGANEGFHTRDFVDCVGDVGRVHAFEPNPSLWHNFIGMDRVRLWPMAIGDIVSVEHFYIPSDEIYHQVGSIVDPRDFMGAVQVKVISVPQVTLDSLNEIRDERVTFIKIDIERRELNCLIGARDFLIRHKPVIVFENNTPDTESILSDFGYNVLSMIDCEDRDIFPNVVAIPSDKNFDIKSIVLHGKEITDLLDWIELQYPDDFDK